MHVARSICTCLIALALTAPASAQNPPPVETTPVEGSTPAAPTPVENPSFFKLVGGDFKNFFSSDTAKVMSYFSVAAVAAAPWDREGVNNGFNIPTALFQFGNVAGSFMFQIGAGAATYGLGRAFHDPRAVATGRDIIRAQILSQALVQSLKYTIQRERPDGSNNLSFPSGHAASAFALAGVIHRHYGWKGGIPAYAFGSYVALARMSWNKHHATDVVMGAGLGLASARTVTIGAGGNQFSVGVQPQTGGASVNISKIYK